VQLGNRVELTVVIRPRLLRALPVRAVRQIAFVLQLVLLRRHLVLLRPSLGAKFTESRRPIPSVTPVLLEEVDKALSDISEFPLV
jgi:hypothetical protein